ncbi:MAG: DUF4302 domain-containing protein [Muribaculaceae bacterium]|nr:DUF4302 domain-containing protein [Muribaculaceae bacterium]
MNKSEYFSIALLGLMSSISSCSNEEEMIFEDSAANRLEAAKSDFSALLTADGGKWAMEYFSNEDEPGYVMVCTFRKGGDVTVAGNNKWLGNTYTEDTSLWEMIADNGPVLTFNSYNKVFHLFSDPADITGPYQPTNPDRDDEPIDETGYGHNGDYEFMILGEAKDDYNEMKLLGKKRGYYTWLRRLPADTDAQAYLAKINEVAANMFSTTFTTLTLTDGVTGEQFVLTKTGDGLFDAYPKDGDPVMQTVSANAIITDKGIRFMTPFEIPRADTEADDYVIESFALQADGSLKAEDGSTVMAPDASELVLDAAYSWNLDLNTVTGSYVNVIADIRTQTKQYRSAFTFSSLRFNYDNELNKLVMTVGMTGRNSRNGLVYFDAVADGATALKLTFADDDNHYDQAGGAYLKNIPALKTLIDVLTAGSINMSIESVMAPDFISCHVGDNASDTFVLNVR